MLNDCLSSLKTMGEVLKVTERAFTDPGISCTGQAERDQVPTESFHFSQNLLRHKITRMTNPLLILQTMDEVLEATEQAFDDASISYTGQVERDWVPTGALSSVNVAMAVHRVGRFAFQEGLSRKDKIQLMKRADVQRLLQMAIEVVGR
jgi:hypothetical protein